MSFQTVVLQAIAQIQTRLNTIAALAKRIFELPAQTVLIPTSKLHVDNSGTSEHITVQQIIDATIQAAGIAKTPIEQPNYADIAAMLANQGNQTPNFIQYVIDAGDDPNVPEEDPNQSRYYRYFGTTNGTLADYELLSSSQVVTLLSNFNTVTVEDVQDNTVPLTEASPNNVGFEYTDATSKMSGVLLNKKFSSRIEDIVTDNATLDYVLKIYNLTKDKDIQAVVSGFSTVNTDYTLVELVEKIPSTDVIDIGDVLEIKFDVDVAGSAGTMTKPVYDPANKAEQVLTIGDKAVANGVASLGGDGKVPAAQLPSYVDDVIEGYYDSGTFYEEVGLVTPIVPTTGKIYIDLSTEDTYRYSGSVYVKISDVLSAADVKTLYESNADTNAFTDTLLAKLATIESNATTDQSDPEIETAYNNQVSQVSGGEITAGTETAVRRFSPADIKAFVEAHETKIDSISFFATDADTDLEVAETKGIFAPYAFTLLSYWVGCVDQVPTGAGVEVDLLKNGVSCTSTAAEIDSGEETSLTGTSPVLTITSFAEGDFINGDILGIGSTDAGQLLQIVLKIQKT